MSHRRPPRRPQGTLLAAAALLVIAVGGGTYAAVKALTGRSGTTTAQSASHPAVTSGPSASPAAQSSPLPTATPRTTPTTTPPTASPAASIPGVPANPPSWALQSTGTPPPAVPSSAVSPSAVSPSAVPPSTTPRGEPSTRPAPSTTRPTATPPATTPTATPPPATSIIVTTGAASNPAEPQVVAFLVRYFTAINDHDYQAFVSLLDAQEAARWTPARFAATFGTTVDSDETLTGIADRGDGREAASVTFTSHQAPSDSPDGSSCDLWSITVYLIPAGGSYVIERPPPGAPDSSSHRACLPGLSGLSGV